MDIVLRILLRRVLFSVRLIVWDSICMSSSDIVSVRLVPEGGELQRSCCQPMDSDFKILEEQKRDFQHRWFTAEM